MSRNRVRRRVGIGIVTAAMLSTAACGGSGDGASAGSSECQFGPTDNAAWTEALEAGVAQGEVNFYNVFAPAQGEDLVKAFNEVCPAIEVTQTATGAALLPAVEAQLESNGDGADLFSWGDSEWFKAHQDQLAELDGPFSAEYPDEGYFVPNKAVQNFLVPLGFLMWNTQEFPDGFEDFEDLLQPEVKGRLGTRGDLTVSYIGFLKFLEDNYGEQYLEDLAGQEPKFYASSFTIPQAVASGEIGVANAATSAAVEDLKAQGAPIDYVIPDQSYSAPHVMGIIEGSKGEAAANVFAQFILSEDGQAAIVKDRAGGSLLDVDGGLDLSGSDVLDAATIPPDVKAEWEAKFDTIFRGR